MRVLVCLSSLPRHFGDFVKSFEDKVLKHIPYPVDLVGHFPETPDSQPLERLLAQVENRLIKVENDPKFSWQLGYDENLIGNQGIEGNLLQWHSLLGCNELKKQLENQLSLTYDWVIWSRPDIYFFNDLRIDFNLDASKLYVLPVDGHSGLNDRFCYGSSDVLDTRMNIFNYFLDVWYPDYHNNLNYLKKKGKIWNRYYCWNPEMVLKQLMIDKDIAYRFTDLVIGKIRLKKNEQEKPVKYVSAPLFDSKSKSPIIKDLQEKLKKVPILEVEDERTKLIEYEVLSKVLNLNN
jgi:hypothetical protein